MKKKLNKIVEIKGYPKLQKVWARLLKQLPNNYHNLNLFMSEHNTSEYELRKGGWSNHGYIVIGREVVKKNDEYIFVHLLAHELGHQVLGHNFHYDDQTSGNELDADNFMLFLAQMAKYDIKKLMEAGQRYEKWRKKGITEKHIKSHATAKEREDLLRLQLRYLGTVL